MILADKIIEERKKNGWSQEELAEQLAVSRQSVSKWESAQAVPDLSRIIQMADLFGVTTDYLLKDEIEPEASSVSGDVPVTYSERSNSIRKVSMEEANDYISVTERASSKIANAVSACIVSPVLLIVLSALADNSRFIISEAIAVGVGLLALLGLVAGAVFVFIVTGSSLTKYRYFDEEEFETAYGVSGLVRELQEEMRERRIVSIAIGVIMCILSVVPLILSSIITDSDVVVCSMVGVLLIIVAVAVNLFVRVEMVWGSYEKLLQEGDYTRKQKKTNKTLEPISSIFWSVITAIYLGVSFLTGRWDITWIIWPVTGVLFGAITGIIKMATKGNS
ncbi:MAG: helix-turn-helix transcriptional regulator [bacterium]|nr:helix-turn-helix transcriptional regulator [bacterium]